MISREQTDDYLKKIIPSDNRITLPSWKKKDYLTMFPIYINFGTKSAKEELSVSFSELEGSQFFEFLNINQNEPYRITPKQFILMMIANRTKVYYDINGQKYHFFEPTSLRSLYDLFFILYNMKNIVSEYDDRKGDMPSDYYLHRSQNRKRLLDYIHFTMRRDFCFSDNENAFIDKLLAQPLERRGELVWEHYNNLLSTNEVRNKIDSTYGEEFRGSEEYYHNSTMYSFGEFFRILFVSSRIGVFSNNFIKFLLATYSIALPAFVEKEKKDYYDGKGDYRDLVNLFGGSLLGNWCDELFGCKTEVYLEDNSKILSSEYKANKCRIVIEKPTDNKLEFSQLEVLFCFLLLSPNWVNQKPIKVEKNDKKYTINAELDPTCFLINGLLIKKGIRDKYGFGNIINGNYPFILYDLVLGTHKNLTLSELIKEIYGGFKVIFENNDTESLIFDSIKKLTSKTIDKKTICKPNGHSRPKNTKENIYSNDIVEKILDYLSEDYKTRCLSNMLKHIDLTYNSIKRAVTDIVYITPDEVNKQQRFNNNEESLDIIKLFYKNLLEQLKETDKVYFADGVNASNSFAARFEKCAIYKCINEDAEKYKCAIYLKHKSVPESDSEINVPESDSEKNSSNADEIELNDLLSQYGQGLFPDNVIEFIEALRLLMIFESKKHIRISKDQSDKITSVLSRSVSQINSTDVFEKDFILNQAINARQDIQKILGIEKNADTT